MEAVRVNFAVGGVAEVQRAFETIEQRMLKFERASVKGAQSEARVRSKEYEKLVRETEKWQRQGVKAAEKAERDKTRAAEKEAKAQAAAHAKASKDLERSHAREVQEADRAERQKTASVERETRKRAQLEAKEDATRRRFARNVTGSVGSGISSLARGVGAMAAGALAIGGGFAIADSFRGRMSEERAAINLSNSAYIPGTNERPDAKKIQARAAEVQAGTHISKEELIKGWQSYVAKSSDFKGGGENLMGLAKLAKGSGSDFGEVMGAAGMLRAQNENMTPEQMMTTMRNIVAQGKLGAVEMKDLAGIASKVTASSAMYSGDQAASQRRLLALSQIAVKTAGNPEEAATAVTRLGSDVLAHQKSLTAAGITGISDAKTGLLASPDKIIGAIMEKAGGHLGKLHEFGMQERSIKIFEALAPKFQEAEAKKKGSGRAAVEAEVRKFTEATYSKEDVENDFAAVMKGAAEKFEGAVLRLKELIADRFYPYLERLIEKLPEFEDKVKHVVDAIDYVVRYFQQNPFTTLGALVSGAILKEIVAARISEIVAKGMATSFGGAAGITIATAAFAVSMGMITIDKMMDEKDKATAKNIGTGADALNTASKLRALTERGELTPAQLESAKKTAEVARQNVAKQKANVNEKDFADKLAGGLFAAEGQENNQRNRESQLKQSEQALDLLNKAIARSTAALEAHGAAVHGAANPSDPKRNSDMGNRGGAKQ